MKFGARRAGSLRRLMVASFVAFRIVRSRRSRTLSLVTLISILGVAFGVMALTVVLGVTGGFETAFRQHILGLYPHVVIQRQAGEFRGYDDVLEGIRKVEGVVQATPMTYDEMMLASGVRRAGSIIEGVDPATIAEVLGVGGLLVEGSIEALSEDPSLTLADGRLQVAEVVTNTWLTVALMPDGRLLALGEDRTPPDPGNARVNVLDLRGGDAERTTLKLTPDGNPDDPFGPAEPVALALRRDAYGGADEVRAGTWKPATGGGSVELPEGKLVTLLLLPDETRVVVEDARVPLPERTAMVRLVHAGTSGSVTFASPDRTLFDNVAPGEVTAYSSVIGRPPGIVLGIDLAERLKAEVGGEVTLVTPLRGIDNKMLGPYGMAPSSSHHRVVGTFRSGYYEHDVRLALVHIDAAQRLLNRGQVIRWIAVKSTDLLQVRETKRKVAAALDPYELGTVSVAAGVLSGKLAQLSRGDAEGFGLRVPGGFLDGIENMSRVLSAVKYRDVDLGYRPRFQVLDWEEMNKNLFGALKLQKVVLAVFFLIITVVGSFVVVGSQVMVVHDKTPDIAILKAMGATKGLVRTIFTLQGVFVASVGTAVGLAMGLGLCGVIAAVDYQLESSVYLINELPVQVDLVETIFIAMMTLLCTMVATQYSAGRAARKSPVEGLRAVD